ncbi:hypothetical protein [Pelomonas cellulosilytica]|uniref:Uncharacterized protein n=1 Tax=Pelomonas cellulosilytica TaxID=2906762 RepID=A0ABS8XYW9_9BURK|nr:hypothetical protein [Pelomonas sp. P8]MCE4555816.1 hypothetical protein [Pelomonas sp. P8]
MTSAELTDGVPSTSSIMSLMAFRRWVGVLAGVVDELAHLNHRLPKHRGLRGLLGLHLLFASAHQIVNTSVETEDLLVAELSQRVLEKAHELDGQRVLDATS